MVGIVHANTTRKMSLHSFILHTYTDRVGNHRWNWSRYFVAVSTASSTFSGCGPLLTHVAPFPTALPPTTVAILAAHSLAERPALLACCHIFFVLATTELELGLRKEGKFYLGNMASVDHFSLGSFVRCE